MKKLIKPCFITLLNNASLLMLISMIEHYEYWWKEYGNAMPVAIITIGIIYLITFSVLVAGIRFAKLPKEEINDVN